MLCVTRAAAITGEQHLVPVAKRAGDTVNDRSDRLDQPLVAKRRLNHVARARKLFDDRPRPFRHKPTIQS